ncbi:16647_t:CDS:1, partial [Acaulospora morrowiae]
VLLLQEFSQQFDLIWVQIPLCIPPVKVFQRSKPSKGQSSQSKPFFHQQLDPIWYAVVHPVGREFLSDLQSDNCVFLSHTL